MKYSEMSAGRIFVLRLETGEFLHEVIESFAREHDIKSATVTIVGGCNAGSKMVVGPRLPIESNIDPIVYTVEAPSEITGTGTVFSDENGDPIMHMHGSVGRDGHSVTGCFRAGIIVWLVLEVVIKEIVGNGPLRKKDPLTGFKILEIE